MKISIESTDKLTYVNSIQVRVWKGKTERGVDCLLFVANVGVERNQDHTEFERELTETLPPAVVIPIMEVV